MQNEKLVQMKSDGSIWEVVDEDAIRILVKNKWGNTIHADKDLFVPVTTLDEATKG